MYERNARQGFLGAQSNAVLSAARIAIVGNCGGGSHVAQQLAHVGIGNFVLVDPDVIEEPNLNRMVGSVPQDASEQHFKTAVLERLICAINPYAKVETYNTIWQKCALALRDCDIVFGCVDGYITRSELEANCRRFMLPYIDVGMDVTKDGSGFAVTGQVLTSLPDNCCMRCMGFLTDEVLAREAAHYGDAGPRPQVVWPNGLLASAAVGIAVHLLCPWNDVPICPYLMYDGNRQTLKESHRLAYVTLGACKHYVAESVGDPLWAK